MVIQAHYYHSYIEDEIRTIEEPLSDVNSTRATIQLVQKDYAYSNEICLGAEKRGRPVFRG